MKLIPNWKRLWRAVSMQMMALAAALQLAWDTNPEAIKAVVPAAWVPYITVALLLVGMAGRAVHQPKVQDESKP